MTIRYFEPLNAYECSKSDSEFEDCDICFISVHFSYDDEAMTLTKTTMRSADSEHRSVSINCEQLEKLKSFADNEVGLCWDVYSDIKDKPWRDAMRSIESKFATVFSAAMQGGDEPPSRAAFGISFK